MFAAGELAMPAHDLALWDISMMNRSLLEPASYVQMLTPVLLKNGANTGYGLGVDLGKRDGHNFIEHSGEVSGFVSENIVFPDDHAAIVVLTNEMATHAARLIADQDHAHGIWASQRQPQPGRRRRRSLSSMALADGHIDRSLFTNYCNAYFNQQTVEDFASSLKPLGPPLSFKETKQEARGGMMFRIFTVTFPDRDLKVTTYQMPDGKLEQYSSHPLERPS